MDQKTKKTWVSILIAGVIITGVLAVAVVGGTVLFFYRHIDAHFTGPQNADQTFADTRAQFAGQQPLVEVTNADEPVIHRDASGPRHQIQALHALLYDERTGKLTRVNVPGWLLRLMSAGGRLRIANVGAFDDEAKLTLDDLERHGPGVVLDVREPHGAQVLIWTE